jgi:hypothetical protein
MLDSWYKPLNTWLLGLYMERSWGVIVFTIPFTGKKKTWSRSYYYNVVLIWQVLARSKSSTWDVEVFAILPRFICLSFVLQNFFLTPTLHLERVILMKVECDFCHLVPHIGKMLDDIAWPIRLVDDTCQCRRECISFWLTFGTDWTDNEVYLKWHLIKVMEINHQSSVAFSNKLKANYGTLVSGWFKGTCMKLAASEFWICFVSKATNICQQIQSL